MPSRLELIRNYIACIRRAPKESKWFFIDNKKEDSFIVSGKRLKLLPLDYDKFNKREEFFIQVNAKDKTVLYMAWDESYVAHLGGAHEKLNKSEGSIEWSLVEDCIYTFLSINMKDITTATTPFADMGKMRGDYTEIAKPNSHGITPGYGIGRGEDASKTTTRNYGPYDYRDNNSGYKTEYKWDSTEYKEREAFTNKLTALLKEGKTTVALDTIADTFSKLKEEKRFDMIDSIINMLIFDKLNIPVMIGILQSSKLEKESNKRAEFAAKVKTHFGKFALNKAKIILEKAL